MSELQYRIVDDSLKHASFASFKSSLSDRYRARKKEQAEQRARNGSPTNRIVGRGLTRNPYGNYKSVYYDPVARHERYLREKDHVTRPYGVGLSESKGSGKGRGGSGKGRGGSGKGSKKNISDAIKKLREESAMDTAAHREAAKRKIEDLREQLKEHLQKLKEAQSDENSTLNVLEIQGTIQSLREQIEKAGLDLNEWISNEKKALQRRIASLKGEPYTDTTEEDEREYAHRQKEINERADAIYKKKSRK